MRTAELLKQMGFIGRIDFDVPMRDLTTMCVGGPAEVVVYPCCRVDMEMVCFFCTERAIPLQVMGKGSNLVVRDGGIEGIVMVLGKDWARIECIGTCLRAQAGATLKAVARAALAQELSGLEFAEGIPGSVGGGIYMNAGAYGGEIVQVLQSALVLTREGKIVRLTAQELDLSYRHSSLMQSGAILLEGEFALQKGDGKCIAQTMCELKRKRREKQPLEYASCGSFFKRPQGYFAGKLIQDAGLKGARVGGAQISEKHAGFLINTGDATAHDVTALMEYVQCTVEEKFGVHLEPEPWFIGRIMPE